MAVAVKHQLAPARCSSVLGFARFGARLISVTVTVNVSLSASDGVPLSIARTRTVNGCGSPPCSSVGVQRKMPLVGSIVAPAGD